jgi:hypothetical protein
MGRGRKVPPNRGQLPPRQGADAQITSHLLLCARPWCCASINFQDAIAQEVAEISNPKGEWRASILPCKISDLGRFRFQLPCYNGSGWGAASTKHCMDGCEYFWPSRIEQILICTCSVRHNGIAVALTKIYSQFHVSHVGARVGLRRLEGHATPEKPASRSKGSELRAPGERIAPVRT